MRKELEEVREILEQIDEGDYRYIEGSEIYDDVSKALATLDRLLGQDEEEMVGRVVQAITPETNGWDSFTQDALRSVIYKQSKAALRAVGLIGEQPK